MIHSMSDPYNPPSDPPRGIPDHFLPAPTRLRVDGWTPEKQRRFVEHLADCGCVSHAAQHVGMTKQSAYALRRRAPNSMFAYAWDAAITLARGMLHDAAMERALEGAAVPVFHRGEQVGERRVYSDRLLMFLLAQGDKLDRVRRPAGEILQLWPAMLASIDVIGPPPLDRAALEDIVDEADHIVSRNNRG